MRGTKILLNQVPQRPGLVTGALDHRDRQAGQRLLQALPPSRRGAVRRVGFRHNVIRHRLDGHQADIRIVVFIDTQRHLARGHPRGKGVALRLCRLGERLLQRHHQAAQPPQPGRGRQGARHRWRKALPCQRQRRAPTAQGTAGHSQRRGHLPQRLARRQPRLGRTKLLCPLQARAARDLSGTTARR